VTHDPINTTNNHVTRLLDTTRPDPTSISQYACFFICFNFSPISPVLPHPSYKYLRSSYAPCSSWDDLLAIGRRKEKPVAEEPSFPAPSLCTPTAQNQALPMYNTLLLTCVEEEPTSPNPFLPLPLLPFFPSKSPTKSPRSCKRRISG
jgi:hypothetical protein